MDPYTVWLFVIGMLALGASWLPKVLRTKPLSIAIIYIAAGVAVFMLPLPIRTAAPAGFMKHLSEAIVILALTGIGLSIAHPLRWRTWRSTVRLLAVTMPLCIAAFAFGGLFAGLPLASAVLLGAVLAPTDPVLASDVQAPPPNAGRSDPTRFALTSEAGLNDGLAFPFTYLAIGLLHFFQDGEPWLRHWLLVDVLYRIAVGAAAGWIIGWAMGYLSFHVERVPRLAETGHGLAAVAITLIAYAGTELLHGYGFLAVFVAAVTLRRGDPGHEYNSKLHAASEGLELLLMSLLLLLIGGQVADGALGALKPLDVLLCLAFVFLVRPLAGWIGLWGLGLRPRQRFIVAFFGIRGIGSIYYFAFATEQEYFQFEDRIWAIVLLTILLSVIVHGVSATPLMRRLDNEDEDEKAASDAAAA